jgi:hypothetical protein
MFGLTTHRRSNIKICEVLDENIRLRAERDTARQERDTAVVNRRQVVQQNAELDAANRRLHDRNLELGRRISALTESDPEYLTALETRLDRALKACARYLAAFHTETRRANRLQARLDGLPGLNDPAVLAGVDWQKRRQDKGTPSEVTS